MSLTVEYYYTPAAGMRTRRQAARAAAQRLPRRMLALTCHQTTDLDISNCMFTLLHQLVQKINVTPAIPSEVLDTLRQCANSRDVIATDVLQTSLAECKSMLATVFNGEQPGDRWKGHAFINRVRTLGRYMRWLACSVLPDVYQERVDNADCS